MIGQHSASIQTYLGKKKVVKVPNKITCIRKKHLDRSSMAKNQPKMDNIRNHIRDTPVV